MKNLIGAVVVIIIVAGGYYFYVNGIPGTSSASTEANLGTYAYACENGSQFTMSPSADMSSLSLVAGSQGMFRGTVSLSKVASEAGQRYEGGGVVFIGAGEGVRLTVGSETTVCNPVPNTENAPWNWGDAGEGGGEKQDAVLIVTESIQGKWQSTDDAKFVREFGAAGKVTDYHDGKVVTSGLWVAFEKGINAPEVPFPLEENSVYIQMTLTGSQADTLNFRLVKLTPEELELVYLDRGGVLKFKAVQ